MGERCKVQAPLAGSGADPWKIWILEHLGPQKLRKNGQLAFESGDNK